MESPDWMRQAACLGASSVMFPVRKGDVPAAKAICARCPVKAECLDQAISTHERFGVWGGQCRDDRARVAKRRKAIRDAARTA